MIRSKRRLRLMVGCTMLLMVLCMPILNVAAKEGEALAVAQAKQRDQQVRVFLTRLNIVDRMDLSFLGPYTLSFNDESRLYFTDGAQVAVMLKGDNLYVYYEGMSINAGKSMTFTRYASGGEGESGIRLTNYPALYMGNLVLDIADGKIRPILHIDVEDYLLGVVPYEMSEAFPLEALKAQAVAARTYAIAKQDPKQDYDVVDTSNDQVFKGYQPGSAQVEQAVLETRGICGFYKGKLAQCYYSASNGGQTERVQTVWPDGKNLPYYAFGEDPYDVENPVSVVRSFDVKKTYPAGEDAPYALRKLLASELSKELLSKGYDAAPESVRVNSVDALSVDKAKGEKGSKLMTMLHITVQISGRTRTDTASPTLKPTDAVSISILSPDETLNEQPAATPVPSYGDFTPIKKSFTLDLPIFKTAEKAFSMDISGHYDNEIWSVAENDAGYTLEARRFGHGLGMSQRGAQWMASQYQKSYLDILAFYYPGLELMQFPADEARLPVAEDALMDFAGPAPTLTPRPTLMPVTQEALPGQWLAQVTGIEDDSTLNLRATPELNGEIVRKLYKNQTLLVLERCPEEGWVKVKTDAIEGFVLEKFLQKEP
ncbi:MAG: SpoIID/LytB domain-containing protein [Clostridia bacterium]